MTELNLKNNNPNDAKPVLGEVKNGEWVFYKNEWFNIYSVKNNKALLHPEDDNGISGGEIIEVDICEINFA